MQVEEALFALCRGCNSEYNDKFKSLKFNISKNSELRSDILSEDIKADALVAMKNTDLADRAKKLVREQLKEESLQETINNDELKNLKEAAAGLRMEKTDAGLAVVDPQAEKAKKEEEEERSRKLEEERNRAAESATEKQKQALIEIKISDKDEEAYLESKWEYVPKAKGEGGDSEDEDGKQTTELVLESQPVDAPHIEPVDEQDDVGDPDAVWDGEVDVRGKRGQLLYPEQAGLRPLRLRAYPLQEAGALRNRIFPRVQVQGYIGLDDMEKYIEAKRSTPQVKMVLTFKLVPREHCRSEYDTLAHELSKRGKGMCLIDDRNWGGLLYCLPSSSKCVSSLLPFGEDECLVAVSITDNNKSSEPAAKRDQPEDIRRTVTNDFAKAVNEKTVVLRLKKSSCNLRLRAIAGDVELDQVPAELKDLSKGQVGEVIEFLLSQKVSVMEVEPEGEQDETEHMKLLEHLVDKQRAAVVLDTERALMYLIPPVDDAGKLLDPPSTTCDSMLGVLLMSHEDPAAKSNEDVPSEPLENIEMVPVDPRGPSLLRAEGPPPQKLHPLEESGAGAVTGQHWQPQPVKAQESRRVPPAVNVQQAPVSYPHQSSPYDPSPRPAYDSRNVPMPSSGPPSRQVQTSLPMQGPPVHAMPGSGWNSQQRGHNGRDGGLPVSPGYPPHGRFMGDNRPDPRQFQHPQHGSHHYGMQGGPRGGVAFNGYDARPPPHGTHNYDAGPPHRGNDLRRPYPMGAGGSGGYGRPPPPMNPPFNDRWAPEPQRRWGEGRGHR